MRKAQGSISLFVKIVIGIAVIILVTLLITNKTRETRKELDPWMLTADFDGDGLQNSVDPCPCTPDATPIKVKITDNDKGWVIKACEFRQDEKGADSKEECEKNSGVWAKNLEEGGESLCVISKEACVIKMRNYYAAQKKNEEEKTESNT